MLLDFRISNGGAATRSQRAAAEPGAGHCESAERWWPAAHCSQQHLSSAKEREPCLKSQPRSRNPGYTDYIPESSKAEK